MSSWPLLVFTRSPQGLPLPPKVQPLEGPSLERLAVLDPDGLWKGAAKFPKRFCRVDMVVKEASMYWADF